MCIKNFVFCWQKNPEKQTEREQRMNSFVLDGNGLKKEAKYQHIQIFIENPTYNNRSVHAKASFFL